VNVHKINETIPKKSFAVWVATWKTMLHCYFYA